MCRRRSGAVWMLAATLVLCAGTASAVELGVTEGLVLWLEADTVTGLYNGETFHTSRQTVWADSATGAIGDGVSQDAVLSDGGPTYYTSRVHGLPAVGFGGGGAFMSADALGISGQAELTAFVVGNRNGGSAIQRAVQIGDTDTGTGGASVGLDTTSAGFRFNDGNRLHANDGFDGLFGVGAWRMTASDTYGTAQYFRDGNLATQTGVTTPSGTIDLTDEGYILGRGLSGTPVKADWYTGDIAEVLVFNRALDDAEMGQVNDYLRDRYSLTQLGVPIPGVDMASLSNVITADPAPSRITEGTLESNTDGFLFVEKESFVLPTDVEVNHNAAGTSTSHGAIAGIVPAGTMVDSFYLSYDLLGDPSAFTTATMDIIFEWPIVGILTGDDQINDVDALLGALYTTYPTGNVGLEVGSDSLTISPDMKTLTITMGVTAGNLDQIRILTVVPEPGSMALLGAGIVGLIARRRRRASD